MLEHDRNFWLAVLGAAIANALIVEGAKGSWTIGLLKTLTRMAVGIWTAIVFIEPVLDWLALNPVVYKAPVAAMLSIMGYSLMRLVVNLVPQDWEGVKEIWLIWRGKK